jgi:hypothetical protein
MRGICENRPGAICFETRRMPENLAGYRHNQSSSRPSMKPLHLLFIALPLLSGCANFRKLEADLKPFQND